MLTGLNRTASYQVIVYGVRGDGDRRQITRFSKAAYVNLAVRKKKKKRKTSIPQRARCPNHVCESCLIPYAHAHAHVRVYVYTDLVETQ